MDIIKYDLVEPVSDKSKPFYFANRHSIVCRFDTCYEYYIEVQQYNPDTNSYSFYLLMYKEKLNQNCRKINRDNYGRSIMRLHNRLDDYVSQECKNRGNVNVDYLESTDEYDVYSVE